MRDRGVEKTTLDRIVFRAVRRVVSDANIHTDAVGKLLKIVLENILPRRIASATITGYQDRRCVGVSLFADPIPIPFETIACKLGRVPR